MNNLTLAEFINKQTRAELLDNDDPRKYDDTEWFIDVIISLLEKYPFLKDKFNINDLSIEQIVYEIEQYFKNQATKRELDLKFIAGFIESHDECRKLESFVLLLVAGLSFIHSFKRLANNQKKVDEVLDSESRLDNVIENINYSDVMPVQMNNVDVKAVYRVIENDSAKKNDIAVSITDFNNKEEIKKILKQGDKPPSPNKPKK